MARESYIYRDGELIPKREALTRDYLAGVKNISDLPAPMIMSDIQPYQSMITGQEIGGRRQHREHLKQHGCIEVGNEGRAQPKRYTSDSAEIKRDIKESIERVKAGHTVRNLVGQKDEDGVTIEAPEVEAVEFKTLPENGTYVRSEAKKA